MPPSLTLSPLLALLLAATPVQWAPEDLRRPALFDADLYCARPADLPTRAAVTRLLARRFPRFRLTTGKAPPHRISFYLTPATVNKLPLPTGSTMQVWGFGLTDAEKQRAQACQGVVSLELYDDGEAPGAHVMEMNQLLAALAAPHDCFILDGSTRRLFSGRAWRAERLEHPEQRSAPISLQINKHYYQNGELYRIVTLGMEKFGLPDLAVDQVLDHDSKAMGRLVDWIVDSLVSGRLRAGGWLTLQPRDGAKGEVRLRIDERQEGDAENRLLGIDFSTAAGANLQQQQRTLLSTLFGTLEGSGHGASGDDVELLAASARARKRWPDVARRCAAGLPFPQKLHLKRKFVMPDDKVEFMWIEVLSCKDGNADGVLENDAFAPQGPRAGLRVTTRAADVYDYALWSNGQRLEGGETEEILVAREKREQAGKSEKR